MHTNRIVQHRFYIVDVAYIEAIRLKLFLLSNFMQGVFFADDEKKREEKNRVAHDRKMRSRYRNKKETELSLYIVFDRQGR